ncbi:MAG: CotH kinase family protein [Lachnospiraceae bacterium]|nr:CotH kinase family protein [Lachnospiraceae bacterium]
MSLRFRKAMGKALSLCSAVLLMLLAAGCAPGPREGSPGGHPVTENGITFSCDSGVYMQNRLAVTITAPEGCTIAYTTNGKTPTAADDTGRTEVRVVLSKGGDGYLIQHRDLLMIPELPARMVLADPSLPSGKVLRAAAVSQTGEAGEAVTKVYFLQTDFEKRFPGCLVVSIVADPADLLDYETGILTPGAIFDAWKRKTGNPEEYFNDKYWLIESNFTQRGKAWERACIVQIYDGDGIPAAEAPAGIRVTGNASRFEGQKSLNVYFREEYGQKYLDYELFDGIGRYRSFRLRSGGNNANWLKFKDAYLQELVDGQNYLSAGTRPAVLFLNGEYWGPYLLTEKLTDQMISDHYGVDKDQVVLFKEGVLEEGKDRDVLLYEALMAYAERDLTDPDVWQEFCTVMDVRSMAEYCAAEIYLGNADWKPDKNDVLWRTRDGSWNEGRWQYILYDVEFSSGMYGFEDGRAAPARDHFRLALEQYPLFAAAIRNPEFYDLFLDALREIGGVRCAPERAEKLLSEYIAAWAPLMPDFYRRFGDWRHLWDRSVSDTTLFFRERYDCLMPLVESYE